MADQKHSNSFFTGLPDFEAQAEEEKRLRNVPKAPSFSLDDMESARKSAFEEGREKGLSQAIDSIEQKTELVIQSLTQKIVSLEQEEAARKIKYQNDTIAVIHASLAKLLPDILHNQTEALIHSALSDFLNEHTPKSQMTVFTAPQMVKSVSKHVSKLQSNLIVEADKSLDDTNIRITWVDGQFEFIPDKMVADVLSIIDSKQSGDGKLLGSEPIK